ncbi:MAG: hypothetical protein JWM42_3556 [Burkholderia sp.]|nr:hypothetical protein [Burkholderia sp.]
MDITEYDCRAGGKMLVLAFALCAATLAHGQDSGKWQFEAAPYIWIAGTDLSARIGATTPAATMNGRVSGTLSSATDAGAMGTLEARRGRLGFLVDMWRLEVSNSSKAVLGGWLGNVTLKTTQDVVGLAAAYRVWNGQTTPVDIAAGARYSSLRADISLSPGLSSPQGARYTDSANWPDVYAGVRVTHALTDKWSLVGYADIGAGVTKKSWQALAGANYTLSKNTSVKFGYRVFNMDFERHRFIYDVRTELQLSMKTSGIYAGLGVKF